MSQQQPAKPDGDGKGVQLVQRLVQQLAAQEYKQVLQYTGKRCVAWATSVQQIEDCMAPNKALS